LTQCTTSQTDRQTDDDVIMPLTDHTVYIQSAKAGSHCTTTSITKKPNYVRRWDVPC